MVWLRERVCKGALLSITMQRSLCCAAGSAVHYCNRSNGISTFKRSQ